MLNAAEVVQVLDSHRCVLTEKTFEIKDVKNKSRFNKKQENRRKFPFFLSRRSDLDPPRGRDPPRVAVTPPRGRDPGFSLSKHFVFISAQILSDLL